MMAVNGEPPDEGAGFLGVAGVRASLENCRVATVCDLCCNKVL